MCLKVDMYVRSERLLMYQPEEIPAFPHEYGIHPGPNIGYRLWFYWDNGKENGDYRNNRDYIGVI